MIEVEKVHVADLEIGMYVSRLDRPWLETPFALQGFTIRSRQDIERLARFCHHVYVDTTKSEQETLRSRQQLRNRPRKDRKQLLGRSNLTVYADHAEWRDEYPRAQEAMELLSNGIDQVFSQVSAGGSLNVVQIKRSVEPMIESIVRNPDACIWLTRMRQQDSYTYQHSLGSSIWAVALGRQLGLARADLRSLAVGGLLFDVGKLQVPQELITAERSLSDAEFDLVRRHVEYGVDMVRASGLMNSDVMDMVRFHHERHNGAGYPQGLRGDGIPIFARIAAVVDCYDAITSQRSYAEPVSPSRAIKMLYDWRDIDFQAEIVEEFIQAVGLYPAGTLVELSSGEVAVVVAEYRTRRLRPQVMVMLDADKAPLQEPYLIDLLHQTSGRDGTPLEITGSLEAQAYGIDMAAIQL